VTENTKALLKQWVPLLIIAAFWVVIVGGQVIKGQFTTLGVIAGSCVVAWLGYKCMLYVLSKRYRSPTPDKLLSFTRASGKVASNRALSAYSNATVVAFWGQYDRSREFLSEISWSELTPMYQGFEKSVLAMLALWEQRDYQAAAGLAREAFSLCYTNPAFPGVKQSREALVALVDVCDLLAGDENPDILARLELRSRHKLAPARMVPAWALATYYTRKGDRVGAEKYANIVRTAGPYCTPLLDFS
jgi:hypothetical protein